MTLKMLRKNITSFYENFQMPPHSDHLMNLMDDTDQFGYSYSI